jgi:ferredoxin--NADP+ reductase
MELDDYSRLTLTDREDFANDLALFRVKAPRPVSFTPGQYATIGLMDDDTGRPLLRPYSVVSTPGSTELEFFIERVDDGTLTPRLWELAEGSDVWMRDKIVGRFVLDTERRHHIMAATVTGVGPYVSIARNQRCALANGTLDTPHRFLILHGGSRSWELGSYREELTALANTYEWINYVPTVSRPWDDPEWNGEVGRVGDVLRKHMDAIDFPPDDTAGYACGHPQMIEKVQGILERTGLPKDAIHEEKYFVERNSA